LAAACAQQTARCDLSVTRDLTFTSANAQESVTASVSGVSCDKTIALYAIHDSDGFPIWSWTSPTPRAFGEVFAANDREHVQAFLERWATPTLTTTHHATEWRLLAPGQTTLDQLTYEDVRARDLPMLCHFSGTARETCVFWEPAAGGAGHLLDRDVEEQDL
jgi:hypothetical protein